MTDFKKHSDVLVGLSAIQEADSDNRDQVREAQLFVNKKDGQWETLWWNAAGDKKPRYTFDMTTPIVDQIDGEMILADFSSEISPAGGDATKDNAALLDGMIRNIENISNAKDIYNLAGRNVVIGGFDGWQVKQEFIDDDSFHQDLVIRPVANFVDSAWFWPYKLPDASDSLGCIVLEAIPRDEYNERWPDGSGQSISENRLADAYFHKLDQIIVGQLYYIDPVDRELLLMSTGEVFEADEVKDVLDEMEAAGITVKDRRKRKKNRVKSRMLDGGDWLGEIQDTVFTEIPVIPAIANFNIVENKVIYFGKVLKLMDPQRVLNYAKSREIEEGALSPRRKIWMTLKQMMGFEDTLATLNTNADPVQGYTNDPEIPGPPQESGGIPINPNLSTLSDGMSFLITKIAGLFSANMGDNPGLQSGVALKRLQDKGDTSTVQYFKSMERAICRTARIIKDSIPAVYDTPRITRILNEDGTSDMKEINQQVFDNQTGKMVTINDMTVGKYGVVCSAGPSFQNRQDESVAAITEVAAVMPEIMQVGADVMLNNITAPGMASLAKRVRENLFNAGVIPMEQWTEEEKRKKLLEIGAIPEDQMTEDEQLQAFIQANQPEQPPDPLAIAAQAEADKAQAQTSKVGVDAQIGQQEQERKNFETQMEAQQQEFDQQAQEQTTLFAQFIEGQQAQTQMLKDSASAWKLMREAMGIDSIAGPGGLQAFIEQAQIIRDQQDQIDGT